MTTRHFATVLHLVLVAGWAHATPNRHIALGTPADCDPSDDVILQENSYVASYNPRRYVPNWVSWNLRKSDLGPYDRNGVFRRSPSLSAEFVGLGTQAYSRSGYDRGHMVPSADRSCCIPEQQATFFLSNVAPQAHALNSGPWEGLERQAREWASDGFDLYIVAGPVFLLRTRRLPSGVAIPALFFKLIVLLAPGQSASDVIARTPTVVVLMPNEDSVRGHAWHEYGTTLDAIEHATGYEFLTAVPSLLHSETCGSDL